MSNPAWDRAALVVSRSGESRRPEIVAISPGLPSADELFTFMRDAELRFRTLRLRIEERTWTARGEQLGVTEVALEHPGRARVTTFEPDRGAAGNHELWLTDGSRVRTYSGRDRRGTDRPVRDRVRGLDDRDFPATSRVYEPLTSLPMETLPELFIHPAGFCQNVLATGRCRITGTDVVAGREAIVLECDHPRSVERAMDRRDFRIELAVDRAEGIVTRLVESVGGETTRIAEVVALESDAPLPAGTFDFEFPPGTTLIY